MLWQWWGAIFCLRISQCGAHYLHFLHQVSVKTHTNESVPECKKCEPQARIMHLSLPKPPEATSGLPEYCKHNVLSTFERVKATRRPQKRCKNNVVCSMCSPQGAKVTQPVWYLENAQNIGVRSVWAILRACEKANCKACE